MRIIFIQPSDAHIDGNLKGGVWHAIPLGIAFLASFLRKNKHEPKIIDLAVENDDPGRICDKFKPDYIGFSVTTPLINYANKLAERLKKAFPSVKIIFGGPHPSTDMNGVLNSGFVDFVVYGEGEYTLLELLDGRPLSEIKGLAYKKDNTIIVNPPRELIQDLDVLPMPAYDLLSISRYPDHPFSKRRPGLSVITSRGCPFGCTYCNKSIFGRSFRKMNYKNVVDQWELLAGRYGIKEFNVVDDVFTLDKERVRDICREIIKRKLNIKWMTPNGVRAELLDIETLKLMKESGCHYLYIGVESGSPRILRRINKGITLEQVFETVKLINKAGIRVGAFFMLGLPDETEEDINKTILLAQRLKLDSVKFGITVPLPGTDMFREFQSKGFIKNFNYSDYFWHKEPVFETDLLSTERIFYYYKKAYREFYFRPQYIFRKISKIRSFGDLREIFNGFWIVLHNQWSKKENKLFLGIIIKCNSFALKEQQRMKILFIYPPLQRNKGRLAPSYIEQQYSFLYPPLGLLYLASNIDRFRHQVKIIDSAALKFSIDDCVRAVKEFEPDILGMTVLTDLLYSVKKIAEGAKSLFPKTRIVLGGPHINIYPHETISFPEVDFCLQRFAEYSFSVLLRAIENNSGYNDVPGLFYKNNGAICKSGVVVDKKIDLDALKIPDRRLLDYSKYFVVIDKNEWITTALSSRGCPHQCTFCDVFQKEYLYRSPENLIEEVKEIVKLGIGFVHFFDDNFNLLKDRVVRFCELLLQENIKIKWAFRGRVISLDNKMAKLLYRAGCRRVQLGVESANQETINIIKKRINLEEVKDVVRTYKKNKISTLGYFIIGFHHENYKECVESLNKAMRFGFDYIEFTVLTPYPNTEIYQQALDKGIKDHWLEFARNPSSVYNIPGMHPVVSREKLNDLINSAYRKFYFSPRFVLKELLLINNFKALTLKSKAALKILLTK